MYKAAVRLRYKELISEAMTKFECLEGASVHGYKEIPRSYDPDHLCTHVEF